jgi:hypothetical protein
MDGMSILVHFDDDEVREYNGESKKDCIAQAKKRCEKMDTGICYVIDCDSDEDF